MATTTDNTNNQISFDIPRSIKYFMYNLQLLPEAYTGADTNRLTLCYFCLRIRSLGTIDKIPSKQHIIDWIYNFKSHLIIIVIITRIIIILNFVFWFIGGTFLGGDYFPAMILGVVGRQMLHGHITTTYTSLLLY